VCPKMGPWDLLYSWSQRAKPGFKASSSDVPGRFQETPGTCFRPDGRG
jgi:hypothetical protein